MGKNKKYRDQQRFPNGKSRLMDPDGDVDMGGPPMERKYNPYAPKNHNSNSKKKHRQQQKNNRRNRDRQSEVELFPWHRITIPYGRKYGKTFILKKLSSLCKNHFNPFNFQLIGNAAEFFLDSYDTSFEVQRLNKKIATPDGFKMMISVAKCTMPSVTFDAETIEIIKKVMSSRYDSMSHCLDLSKFYADTSLKTLGLYLPLQRPTVLSAIAKVIKENIPELQALDLTGNKLTSLDSLSIITHVCKELKAITFKNNKLRKVSDLSPLKGLDIVDLVLDGNPLCDDFKDKNSYISAVRDLFPKLTHLDGTVLPATIGFDLGTEKLPLSKKSFFASDDVKEMVIQFLDLYYTIYDSGDRSKLLDAYHDQALFSLCIPKSNHNRHGKGNLGAYTYYDRNLLVTEDSSKRFQLLKHGKISILNTLSDLPQTMHDPTSFSIDIFHISPSLMGFSVTGVFKEVARDMSSSPLKSFNRTYFVAPQGQGLVITNENVFIATASSDQVCKAFKVPAPTPSPSPAPPLMEEKSPQEKQLMVIELSKQTGMNLDFSTKCLEENDWDYQRAFAVFLKFQSEGKLPPEAFIHQ